MSRPPWWEMNSKTLAKDLGLVNPETKAGSDEAASAGPRRGELPKAALALAVLKTCAGRCFGQLVSILKHAVTCSKRLQADVFGRMQQPLAATFCRESPWLGQI